MIYSCYQLITSNTKSMTATCTNFGASIGLEPNYGARARMGGGPLLPLRRADRDAAHRRGRERERGMGRLGAAKRGSGARHRLQAFLQAFPNLGCFSPSFSKESFGRFVGFQWVARLPNPKSPLPNILLSPWARRTRRTRPDQWGSLKAHRNTLAWMPFFRKKNRRFLFQCASAGRGVLRSGRLPMFRWQTTQTAVRSARDGGSIDGSPSAVRQMHDVLRDAGAGGHSSPGAQPDRAADRSALQLSRSGRVRGACVRSAKSTVRFVYGDLPFYSVSPLENPGTLET